MTQQFIWTKAWWVAHISLDHNSGCLIFRDSFIVAKIGHPRRGYHANPPKLKSSL